MALQLVKFLSSYQIIIFQNSKTQKLKFWPKIKLHLGIIFYLLFIVGCFLIIFVIEAQQEKSRNKVWGINFVIAFIQDLTLSPLISIANKVWLFKLSQRNCLQRFKRKFPWFYNLLLPSSFRRIYVILFSSSGYLNKFNRHQFLL